jgi:hypothetical protein
VGPVTSSMARRGGSRGDEWEKAVRSYEDLPPKPQATPIPISVKWDNRETTTIDGKWNDTLYVAATDNNNTLHFRTITT